MRAGKAKGCSGPSATRPSPGRSSCRRPTSPARSISVTRSTSRCRTSSPATPACRARTRSGSRAWTMPASPPRWWSSGSSRSGRTSAPIITREEFVEKVWEWKAESGGAITRQLRRLGASCDWANERFTMDEGFSRAVLKVFVDLYKRGLLYRDKRLVNWDPNFEHRHLRPRGRNARGPGPFLAFPLSARGRQRRHPRRHHAARDDARRHGGRGPSRRRALQAADRHEGPPADHRAARADHRRRACRSGARLGRGQDHAGPRLQRFRGRQARRLQARRDAQHVRRRGARHPDRRRPDPRRADRPRPLRGAQARRRAARGRQAISSRSRTASSSSLTATARAW